MFVWNRIHTNLYMVNMYRRMVGPNGILLFVPPSFPRPKTTKYPVWLAIHILKNLT